MPRKCVKYPMTSVDRHKDLLKQSSDLLELAIARGAFENSRTVAFATSSGSVDVLSIFLHRIGKLSAGGIIEHQWFKQPKHEQKKPSVYELRLDFDFPQKKVIFSLMCAIEEKRDKLAYGNPTETDITATITAFKKLKELLEQELGESFD